VTAKHRRRLAKRPPDVDPLPLSLPDVYLLTAESAGQLAVGQLTLVIDDQGLAVLAPDGSTATALTWAELTVLQTTGRTTSPDGQEAVLLEAASSTRTHRFAVPAADPVLLERTVALITGVPGAEVREHPRRRRRLPRSGD
jgi:hypothetical protein